MSEAAEAYFEPTFNRSVKRNARDHRLSSNGGALLLREADERLGLVSSLAGSLHDPRRRELIRYHLDELLRERIYALALGYSADDEMDFFPDDKEEVGHRTDARGQVVLQNLVPGEHRITARRPVGLATVVRVEITGPGQQLEFQLGGATLRGQVLGGTGPRFVEVTLDSGRSLPDFAGHALAAEAAEAMEVFAALEDSAGSRITVACAPDGSFEVRDLSPGHYFLSPYGPGHFAEATLEVDVADRDLDGVILRLLEEGQLSFDLRNFSGGSFGGGYILLVTEAAGPGKSHAAVVMQETGTFPVSGLPPGSYRVQLLFRPVRSPDAQSLREWTVQISAGLPTKLEWDAAAER
ncbi:MAG TPA: transposase [Planctomycetota bacterium]